MIDILVLFGKLCNTFYIKFFIYLGRTYRKAPQKPPTSVRFYRVNSTTVKLIWRYVEPTLEEEPLKGYKVAYINYIYFRLNKHVF